MISISAKNLNENYLHPLFIISKIIFHKINLFFFFSIFSEMTNETNCPYCPPGMECDSTTYTCVKGSYEDRTPNFDLPFFIYIFFQRLTRPVNMYVLYILYIARFTTCNFNFTSFFTHEHFHDFQLYLSFNIQIFNLF